MKKLFPYLFFTACLLLFVESGNACTCVAPRAEFVKNVEAYVNYERDKAGAVFSGKVSRIDQLKDLKGKPTGVVRVSFAVDKSWKDAETSHLTVSTTNVCCICGYPFEVGEQYLVYALGSDSQNLKASICSQTKKFKDAAEDLNFLGEAKVVSEAKKSKIRAPRRKPRRASAAQRNAGDARNFSEHIKAHRIVIRHLRARLKAGKNTSLFPS